MKMMKWMWVFAMMAGLGVEMVRAQSLIISQYVETESGTIPKGIELWNAGETAIDFSVTPLDVQKGNNGGAPQSDFTLNSGTLDPGAVWVIGTSDMGTYLDNTFGAGTVNFSVKGFTFNGDDALVVLLDGVTNDVFGTVGVDPGTAWSGNGVSSANQNISILPGVNTGDVDGWTDPSGRFETISTSPTGAGGLDGFGVAPVNSGPTTNVSFALISSSAGEADGTFDIVITKSLIGGDVTGEIALGGTATITDGISPNDYAISSTNFQLSGAVTSTTVTITIEDDLEAENTETIELSLVNIVGGIAFPPTTFTLDITDNDLAPSPLIISEVSDPADIFFTQFVELYNGGAETIDLGAGSFYLSIQVNGGATWGDIPLTGSIAAGETYVIAFSNEAYAAAYPLARAPDLVSGEITGNGDDGYFLYSGGAHTAGLLVDAYGVLDQDGTGQAWEYSNGKTYRNDAISSGSSSWTSSEWTFVPGGINVMSPGVHPESLAVVYTNVSFGVFSALLQESSGSYTVLVNKTLSGGDVTGEVTVGGTATEGVDYTITGTNILLSGITTQAAVVVELIDDADFEPEETIELSLVNVTGGTLVTPSSIVLTIAQSDPLPPQGGAIWINEINYDPPGTDAGEFVEVAGPAGTDLSVYSLVLYNGSGGVVYNTTPLAGILPDEGCGVGALVFNYPSNGLQNGGPDGMALVSNSVTVLEFVSYEGTFVATDGPAAGLTSVSLGVNQNNSDTTIQLSGIGTNYSDYSWVLSVPSPGSMNLGQTAQLSFETATAAASESSGTYTVTVFKAVTCAAVGSVTGQVVLSGSASLGSDYSIDTTNVVMDASSTSAVLIITLTDDADIETDETIVLELVNVAGAELGANRFFNLTVSDNDTVTGGLDAGDITIFTLGSAGGTLGTVNADGGTFQLYYKTNLLDQLWTPVPDTVQTGTELNFVLPPPADPVRIYGIGPEDIPPP